MIYRRKILYFQVYTRSCPELLKITTIKKIADLNQIWLSRLTLYHTFDRNNVPVLIESIRIKINKTSPQITFSHKLKALKK